MATPSRSDRMIQNFMKVNASKGKGSASCSRQFPECPTEPNDTNCKMCTF